MASQQPAPAPTTITALSDDLLREIFLHLPDLPSLVRAALACRDFRRAVRSSPAFRRSFRALHPPPLVAFFLEPNMEVVPVFPSPCNRPDPGLLAADFFGIRLSRPRAPGWEILPSDPSADGYLILVMAGSTNRRVAYNPLMQALDLLLYQPDISFQFYTLSSQDGQGPSHVLCVLLQRHLVESTAFVFSLETMEWQISRKASLRLREPDRVSITCMVVRGLICWRGWMCDQIVLFDTATCQFSLIDLPTPLKMESSHEPTYRLGETKDEKFCIVDIHDNALVSWFMTTTATNDSVVERWMMYRKFSLHPIINKFTGCSIEEGRHVSVDIVAVIDGFVYLSIYCSKDMKYFEVYLSICLETSEISELFNGAYRHNQEAHPYVMAWPPSLVQNKEESETGFMGDSVSGPVGTKEASTVLVTALQSFRQALMNESDSNEEIVAQLDAFLGPSKEYEGPLFSKMATLDAQLRTARDRILRIRACSAIFFAK